jgi:hypothetical protein
VEPRAVTSWRVGLGLAILCGCTTLVAGDRPSVSVGLFPQEVPKQITELAGVALLDAEHLYLDADGQLHLLTPDRHWLLGPDAEWRSAPAERFPAANHILADGARLLLATDDGIWAWRAGQSVTQIALPGSVVNTIAIGPDGRLAAATDRGLMEKVGDQPWQPVEVLDAVGRRWGARDVRVVVYDSAGQLWLGQLAGVACRSADGWRFHEGRDGLPYADFTSAAAGPDGRVWFGTRIGLVGWNRGEWLYRQGPRFMPGDHVRSVVVTADGTPWLATDGGLAALESQPMRLADKAAFYEQQIDRSIKRTPYGYTSVVELATPGDLSEIIYKYSENDGLWTCMYGASQCFATAVTGSPEHRSAAKQAFEAIRFLQKVTQGGEPAPPHGFIARSILAADGVDPNVGHWDIDRQIERTRKDRLWKVYEPRWPRSADRQWYWKADTSSDELDGHYFFLPLYYDLVAEDEIEKERVREVVRDLTDHLLEHNFQLVDIDGKATRWAVYNPENLNQNRDWWAGRGLNSLSIMAYLTVAQHITGDAKYAAALDHLRTVHSYEANAMVPKVQYGPGSGNQGDDEMAMMCFYSLIKYTPDAQLQQNMLYSMHMYWRLIQAERNPLFHFLYAVHGFGATHETPFGKRSIEPGPGWLEDSLQTLTGFPLDRINWPLRNSHRLDLVDLPNASRLQPGESSDNRRGHRVDGRVLPIENRYVRHWSADPWRFDYPGDGTQLASGTVFLLPYWLGRYHGFIDEDRQGDGGR